MEDLVGVGNIECDIVILVDAKFHLDVERFKVVLEAKQGCVDLELRHGRRRFASLEIMDSQGLVSEPDSVGVAVAIVGKVKQLFWGQSETDSVVDVLVQRSPCVGEFDLESNRLGSEIMKLCAAASFLAGPEHTIQLFLVIVDPRRGTRREEGMRTRKLLRESVVWLQIHRVLPLRSRGR